jgi:hypothetical protein
MANEMFLDTSLKRSSVISHAKALGYRPRSNLAAKAKISLTLNSVQTESVLPQVFVIRRGTRFISGSGNSSYSFVTTQNYSAPLVSGQYEFPEIEIVQGNYNVYAWPVLNDTISTKYVIPNSGVDVTSMRMEIYESNTSLDFTVWNRINTVLDVTEENSRVYFTQESLNGKHEIYFGNGVSSAMPSIGNVIRVEYITTQGFVGNGMKTFLADGAIYNDGTTSVFSSDVTISTIESSSGGANAETISEIKHFASNHFAVQNRAVTVKDYESIIRENFGNVNSIKVWGGEENTPKYFGTVFVCIKPKFGEFITQSEENQIVSFMSAKTILNQKIKFIRPEYLYFDLDMTVYYTPSMLSTGTNLTTLITDNIVGYSATELEQFNSIFRYSQFCNIIDTTHASIKSNITNVKLYKTLLPILNKSANYVANFGNAIKEFDFNLVSPYFYGTNNTQQLLLTNIGANVVMGYYDVQNKFVAVNTVGSINYKTGEVVITNLYIQSMEDEFNLKVTPKSNDIISRNNNVCQIKSANLKIKTVIDSVANRV